MKKLIILAAAVIASIVAFGQTKAGKIDNTEHAIIFACPAQSEVISNEPGKCPFCGMDLNLSPKEELKTQISKSYSCPRYADVTSDKTGRKLNISPKEEMKMQIARVNRVPAEDLRDLVAK